MGACELAQGHEAVAASRLAGALVSAGLRAAAPAGTAISAAPAGGDEDRGHPAGPGKCSMTLKEGTMIWCTGHTVASDAFRRWTDQPKWAGMEDQQFNTASTSPYRPKWPVNCHRDIKKP
jgi:hypothetical protein